MRTAAPWLMSVLLTACASEASRQHVVLAEIVKTLPGRYDNLAQVQAEVGAGTHVPTSLQILALQTPVLGADVVYVREASADDARRVLGQRIWSFVQDKKGRVLQVNYVFKEPQRWLRALAEPELLQSLTPDDLVYVSGCELIWSKLAASFNGAVNDTTCRPGTASAGLLVELHAVFTGTALTLTEQQVGPNGGALTAAGTPYKFDKHGAN